MIRLLSALCVLAAALLDATSAHAEGLRGEWCGTALQSGPGPYRSEWPATMLLEGATGRMDYPSLGCGGPLMLERSDGPTHYYRERITYGRDLCIDDGLIAVRLEAGSVHWRWEGSGATATAVLTPTCRLQSQLRHYKRTRARRCDLTVALSPLKGE